MGDFVVIAMLYLALTTLPNIGLVRMARDRGWPWVWPHVVMQSVLAGIIVYLAWPPSNPHGKFIVLLLPGYPAGIAQFFFYLFIATWIGREAPLRFRVMCRVVAASYLVLLMAPWMPSLVGS